MFVVYYHLNLSFVVMEDDWQLQTGLQCGIMNSLFGSFAHASHIFSQNLCLGCLASASLTLERISRLVIA